MSHGQFLALLFGMAFVAAPTVAFVRLSRRLGSFGAARQQARGWSFARLLAEGLGALGSLVLMVLVLAAVGTYLYLAAP